MKLVDKSSVIIREGVCSDNDGLVSLSSLVPMKGKLTIRVDRKPDFFGLLEARGSSFVIVAETNSRIVGSLSVSAVPVYLNGTVDTAYYLADFKVHPDFRKSKLGLDLAEAAIKKLHLKHANLLFTAVIEGNRTVASFLNGSSYWPPAIDAGRFNVYLIIPVSTSRSSSKYMLNESSSDSSCVNFFNDFAKDFCFAPVLEENSFENTTLLTASYKNELVAAICLADVGAKKQERLAQLPFCMKIGLKIANVASAVFSVTKLPQINEEIKILYVRTFACKQEHEYALRLLFFKARNIAFENNFHFLAVGIHERNSWKIVLSRLPKFTFKSNMYVSSMVNDKVLVDKVLSGAFLEDYSLV
jgi:GNAT superfamily N-acetyltransferase